MYLLQETSWNNASGVLTWVGWSPHFSAVFNNIQMNIRLGAGTEARRDRAPCWSDGRRAEIEPYARPGESRQTKRNETKHRNETKRNMLRSLLCLNVCCIRPEPVLVWSEKNGKRQKGGELRRPSGHLCVSFVHQMLREMVPGRTGNEVLASVVSAMGAESIEGRIYTHPIGDVMHAAGPNIGLADMNNGPLAASGTFQLRAEVSASFIV
jgi:hypothetical protein